jgi:hypothetical protein
MTGLIIYNYITLSAVSFGQERHSLRVGRGSATHAGEKGENIVNKSIIMFPRVAMEGEVLGHSATFEIVVSGFTFYTDRYISLDGRNDETTIISIAGGEPSEELKQDVLEFTDEMEWYKW